MNTATGIPMDKGGWVFCVFVCVCISEHVNVRVFQVCVCLCVCVSVCAHVCMCQCVGADMHECACVCTYVSVFVLVLISVFMWTPAVCWMFVSSCLHGCTCLTTWDLLSLAGWFVCSFVCLLHFVLFSFIWVFFLFLHSFLNDLNRCLQLSTLLKAAVSIPQETHDQMWSGSKRATQWSQDRGSHCRQRRTCLPWRSVMPHRVMGEPTLWLHTTPREPSSATSWSLSMFHPALGLPTRRSGWSACSEREKFFFLNVTVWLA